MRDLSYQVTTLVGNTIYSMFDGLGIFHFGQLWSHGNNHELLHRNSTKRAVDSDEVGEHRGAEL